MSEAEAAPSLEGNRPPGEVIEVGEHLAASVQNGIPPPASPARFTVPPPWTGTPGARALIEALNGAVRLLSGKGMPEGQQPRPRPGRRERLAGLLDRIRGPGWSVSMPSG